MKGFKWWKPKTEMKKDKIHEHDDATKEEEMSELDNSLPKYYEGYDIDNLINKIRNGQQLTREESLAYIHASDIYSKKRFEHRKKIWEEQEKIAKKSGNPFALDHRVNVPFFNIENETDKKG